MKTKNKSKKRISNKRISNKRISNKRISNKKRTLRKRKRYNGGAKRTTTTTTVTIPKTQGKSRTVSTFTSPSGFSKYHYEMNRKDRTSSSNGWKECEIFKDYKWISIFNL